ncbi:MAG: hypothetical protein WBP70_14765, partial [Terriglobales bacterium]
MAKADTEYDSNRSGKPLRPPKANANAESSAKATSSANAKSSAKAKNKIKCKCKNLGGRYRGIPPLRKNAQGWGTHRPTKQIGQRNRSFLHYSRCKSENLIVAITDFYLCTCARSVSLFSSLAIQFDSWAAPQNLRRSMSTELRNFL